MSEYGEDDAPGISLWQELQNETIRLDSRKSSSSSEVKWKLCILLKSVKVDINQYIKLNTFQASTDSLDSAEDFKPVEINLGEIKEMLSMYKKRRISTSALTGSQAKQTTI